MSRFPIPVALLALAGGLAAVPLAAQEAVSPAARAAMATITEADVARRIGIIAHDSMGGRNTPSRGLDLTAAWIASEFRRFGPGKLLIDALVRYAVDARLERFEFLGDDEPWKREWANAVRECHRVEVFDRTPLGVAARGAVAFYRRWARPSLKHVLHRVRRFTASRPTHAAG